MWSSARSFTRCRSAPRDACAALRSRARAGGITRSGTVARIADGCVRPIIIDVAIIGDGGGQPAICPQRAPQLDGEPALVRPLRFIEPASMPASSALATSTPSIGETSPPRTWSRSALPWC